MALKWTNIHKKSSIWKNIYKTHEFFHEKQILLYWLIILNILGIMLVKMMNQENFWLCIFMNSLKILKFPYFGEIDCTNLVIWQKVPIFQSKFAKFVQFWKPKTRPGYPGFLKSKPETCFFKTCPRFAITIQGHKLRGWSFESQFYCWLFKRLYDKGETYFIDCKYRYLLNFLLRHNYWAGLVWKEK